MIKVTVLYNIAPTGDVQAFEAWRRRDHQKENASAPGVVRTDFYIARDAGLGPPAFRYVTESYYADQGALEAGFLSPARQEKIRSQVTQWQLTDFTVLVSEEVASSAVETDGS